MDFSRDRVFCADATAMGRAQVRCYTRQPGVRQGYGRIRSFKLTANLAVTNLG